MSLSFTTYGRDLSFDEWLAEMARLHPKARFCLEELTNHTSQGPCIGAFGLNDECYGAYNASGSYFAWTRNAGEYPDDVELMTPREKELAGLHDY